MSGLWTVRNEPRRPWRFLKAKKEHTDRGTVKAAFGEDNAGIAYGGLHTVFHDEKGAVSQS